jgi:proteasome lid subunit RPN8/RPN11
MIQAHQPVDPVIHHAARRHARRCVGLIEGLLREEEVPDAAREFYRLAREDMEALKETLNGRDRGGIRGFLGDAEGRREEWP